MIALRYVPIDRTKYPLPRRRAERFPLERLTLLALLDDETLYTPSAVAEFGYFKGSKAYRRACGAFRRFGNYNGFQETYEIVEKRQGMAAKAWLGASWKMAAGGQMHRVADLMAQLWKRQQESPGECFVLNNETLLSERELFNAEAVKRLPSPKPTHDTQIVVVQAAPPPPSPWRYSRLLLVVTLVVALGLLVWSDFQPLTQAVR